MKCLQVRVEKVIDFCERLLLSPSLREYYQYGFGEIIEIKRRAEKAMEKGWKLYPCEHADEKGICKGFKEGQSTG